MERYAIREHSLIARLAAWKLQSEAVAIVIGKTIHLHNATRQEFLSNTPWLRHELVHIRQFREHGFVPFLLKYLWESCKHGYYRNRFEAEARQGEYDACISSAFGITESGNVRPKL